MSVDVTHISVLVAQFPISLDIEGNLDTILSLLEHAEKDDLVPSRRRTVGLCARPDVLAQH